jgi:predicted nucleic acid-binding protein
MPFVLDCSVAICWAFEDQATPLTRAALARLETDRAVVPAIWPIEVANVLLTTERRRKLTPTESNDFVESLRRLGIVIRDHPPAVALRTLALGREYGLTAYDALYLDLAAREDVPLATLDEQLRAAAQKMGVELL